MRDVSLMSRLQLRAICLMLRVPAFLDKFVSSLVNKCRIHNVISFRGWHSEWNRGLQVHYSFLFSFFVLGT